MISYSEIEIPSRVNHLWRYTPWKRVHPTSVEEVPDIDSIKSQLPIKDYYEFMYHSWYTNKLENVAEHFFFGLEKSKVANRLNNGPVQSG